MFRFRLQPRIVSFGRLNRSLSRLTSASSRTTSFLRVAIIIDHRVSSLPSVDDDTINKVWQIAIGSGIKCNSAVWRALRTLPGVQRPATQTTNPTSTSISTTTEGSATNSSSK
jgi:hypothetical protein